MKKLLGIAIFVGLVTCAGCFTAGSPDATKLTQAPIAASKSSVPPVTADQVTAQNARRMAQALREELDREAEQDR